MFTGIIEEVGTVASIERRRQAIRLAVRCRIISEDIRTGDSIAINGVCLTATGFQEGSVSFDAVAETLARSSLGRLRAGDPVNLERSLQVGGRIGGHFVQGHVDGTGTVQSTLPAGSSTIWTFAAPHEIMRYIVSKGAIAVDGISLTVVEVFADSFTVSIVPFTVAHTNLSLKRTGDPVNLEADILSKYVEKLLHAGRAESKITEEFLAIHGFRE